MADIQKFLDQAGVSTLWSRVAEELNKKAVAADVYTKTEVDNKIAAVPVYDDTANRFEFTNIVSDTTVTGTGTGTGTDTAIDETTMVLSDVDVGAIGLWASSGHTMEFDIKIYVNDIRYV